MKRVNTLIFIAGATLLNMALTGGFFLVFFLLYVRFLVPLLPGDSAIWGFPVIFILAIAASFAVYRRLVKLVFSRIKAEQFFGPVKRPK